MPGKGNPLLSVRIPKDLEELLEQKITTSGESKSEITIAALNAYLMPSSAEDELSQLKRRVELLEKRLSV